MINVMCLNENYSTTRLLTKEKPLLENRSEDKFETILFLPENTERKAEGGLRTIGYFKKSYEHKPLISIVTVVFNGKNFIEETIQSVINQTYKNVEYIVIDGGSTDGTIDVIKKYEDKIDYWVSEKDNGIYDAMNKGLDVMTGNFVLFINTGDKIYDKNTIQMIFLNYCDEDAFYGETQLINEEGTYASVTKTPKCLTWKNFMHGMVVSHQSIILSTKYVNKYNLDYEVVSDQDWVISTLRKCKKIKNSNLIISKYLMGGFSNKNFYKGWANRFQITLRQYGQLALALNFIYFLRALAKKLVRPYISNRK